MTYSHAKRGATENLNCSNLIVRTAQPAEKQPSGVNVQMEGTSILILIIILRDKRLDYVYIMIVYTKHKFNIRRPQFQSTGLLCPKSDQTTIPRRCTCTESYPNEAGLAIERQ